MKRLIPLLLIVVFLSGCASGSGEVDDVVSLRSKLQTGRKCTFEVDLAADYGDSFSTFALSCAYDDQQNMEITVLRPESISGVTCKISGGKGNLMFDEEVVAFEMIADGLITPISAPWLIIKALRGGYISATTTEKEGILVRLDDSYNGVVFNVDIWLDENKVPKHAEIIWQGKRIVSMGISNFEIL